MGAQRVGIREIRQNLSRYLSRVARGEAFEITDHNRPVAVLGPIPETGSALDRLVTEGRVIRGTGTNLADLGPPPRVEGPPLSRLLDEVREDRI